MTTATYLVTGTATTLDHPMDRFEWEMCVDATSKDDASRRAQQIMLGRRCESVHVEAVSQLGGSDDATPTVPSAAPTDSNCAARNAVIAHGESITPREVRGLSAILASIETYRADPPGKYWDYGDRTRKFLTAGYRDGLQAALMAITQVLTAEGGPLGAVPPGPFRDANVARALEDLTAAAERGLWPAAEQEKNDALAIKGWCNDSDNFVGDDPNLQVTG